VRERRVGLEQQVVPGGLLEQDGLGEVRVVLDLVGEDRPVLERLLDERAGEVADAEVADQPAVLQLGHRADRLGDRHVGVRPVQEQQVDVVAAGGAASPRRRRRAVGREVAGPDLRGQEDLGAVDAGGLQPLPHLALVVVHPRGVDVAVAEAQRVLDALDRVAPGDLPGAVAELGDLGALDGEGLGGGVLAMGAHADAAAPPDAAKRRA
jgi:hypothetical protein